MSMSINTNVMSLNAQRNASNTAGSLATSMQRLSSGLRINSARDDAAGLAIAERMNTQVRGLNVAARNANDGISLAQTAEGALGNVGNMLQRMRELAVQSSNATNTNADRAALDAEVQSLKQEIDRVADQTRFNGTRLLDGSFGSQRFQVGANAGETITVGNIANARLNALGGQSTVTQLSATIGTGVLDGFGTPIADNALRINGINIGPVAIASSAVERANQLVDAINRVSSQSSVGASFDATTNQITLRSTASVGIDIVSPGATSAGFATGAHAAPSTPNVTGITDLNVRTFADSQIALGQIDNALNSINTSRANLGALQSRFDNAISNIRIASENTSAARGRIMDADFAAETANLSRAQILQQAGVAMVAQANQMPQQVLSLLR